MEIEKEVDYAEMGLSIQQALLAKYRHASRRSTSRDLTAETPWIRWGERQVRTSDTFSVPSNCVLTLTLQRWNHSIRQGVELEVESGGLQLRDGTTVRRLRTWCDPHFEDEMTYPLISRTGYLTTWNVYDQPRGLEIRAEYWTANSGMWVEVEGPSRTYHCSAGPSSPPTFEDLVFTVRIDPA